jgi:hypothetical protein
MMFVIFSRMIWLTCKPVKLVKKNFDRYVKESKKIISRGVETELRELGHELFSSVPKIIKYVEKFNIDLEKNQSVKDHKFSQESPYYPSLE